MPSRWLKCAQFTCTSNKWVGVTSPEGFQFMISNFNEHNGDARTFFSLLFAKYPICLLPANGIVYPAWILHLSSHSQTQSRRIQYLMSLRLRIFWQKPNQPTAPSTSLRLHCLSINSSVVVNKMALGKYWNYYCLFNDDWGFWQQWPQTKTINRNIIFYQCRWIEW